MSEWKKINIGQHINTVLGYPFDSNKFNIDGVGLPLIRIRDLLDSTIATYYSGDYTDEYLIAVNDILIGMDGDFNIVRWKNRSNGLLNQRIMKISQKECSLIDVGYLFYFLIPYLRRIHNITPSTTVKHLSHFNITDAIERFPSLPEQRKIAHILSMIDDVIEKTEAAIEKYKAIKQGMMHDLFTRGIDLKTGKLRPSYDQAPQLYKETELGWIPKEWETPQIDALAAHVGSGITPTGGSKVYRTEGILFIRSQNVHFDGLHLEDVAFITEEIHSIMERSKVNHYDVLLNITGASIGRCCYFPDYLAEANVNQHVCIVRLPNPTKPKAIYLSEFLSSAFGQVQIDRLNAGGNREGLNYQQLRAFYITWPENETELEKIATAINTVNTNIKNEIRSLEKIKLLKQALMADLLTGRVRVKYEEEALKEAM